VTRRLALLSGAPRVSTKESAEAGGARQHLLGTISGFRANGWEVSTYIVGDKVPEQWLKGNFERNLAASGSRRLAADIIRMCLAAIHSGLAVGQMRSPEWVYERCGAFQLMGYLFQRRGIPWILETNYLMFEELTTDRKSVALAFLVRRIEEFAYRKCDILVAVSDELKRAIVQKLPIPPEKIVVVPNAADTEVFNPDTVTPRRLFGADVFVIGFQGSMYEWAGLENLLRAVAALRRNHLGVAAVLLGDGHERTRLESLAADLGIAEYVVFPGFVPRHCVPEYIAGFDLCYSGQLDLKRNAMYLSPLKLYDYMAMGKPVIAARFVDAITLTKDGETGYLFTPDNLGDLIETATRAYAERHNLSQLGAAARAAILAHHSWASRIRDFIPVAEQMLAERPARNSVPSE